MWQQQVIIKGPGPHQSQVFTRFAMPNMHFLLLRGLEFNQKAVGYPCGESTPINHLQHNQAPKENISEEGAERL